MEDFEDFGDFQETASSVTIVETTINVGLHDLNNASTRVPTSKITNNQESHDDQDSSHAFTSNSSNQALDIPKSEEAKDNIHELVNVPTIEVGTENDSFEFGDFTGISDEPVIATDNNEDFDAFGDFTESTAIAVTDFEATNSSGDTMTQPMHSNTNHVITNTTVEDHDGFDDFGDFTQGGNDMDEFGDFEETYASATVTEDHESGKTAESVKSGYGATTFHTPDTQYHDPYIQKVAVTLKKLFTRFTVNIDFDINLMDEAKVMDPSTSSNGKVSTISLPHDEDMSQRLQNLKRVITLPTVTKVSEPTVILENNLPYLYSHFLEPRQSSKSISEVGTQGLEQDSLMSTDHYVNIDHSTIPETKDQVPTNTAIEKDIPTETNLSLFEDEFTEFESFDNVDSNAQNPDENETPVTVTESPGEGFEAFPDQSNHSDENHLIGKADSRIETTTWNILDPMTKSSMEGSPIPDSVALPQIDGDEFIGMLRPIQLDSTDSQSHFSEESSVAESAFVREFLDKIPDLSYMLQSTVCIPLSASSR